MTKGRKIIWIVLGAVFLLLLVFVIYLGTKEIPQDEILDPADYGAGSSTIQPSYTGLFREFPEISNLDENPMSQEKLDLGYFLFFDPILSKNDDMACATCHHPDLGFSDGLPQSLGRGGVGVGPDRTGGVNVGRNAPTLWNVAYTSSLFWDGRASTLESQALVPLHHVDEMAADIDGMIADLKAIPVYVAMFEAAFPDLAESISQDTIVQAIATFERTLISENSPFDQYAQGELYALTPSQLRGLDLFRSSATRCFECHTAPTFHTETFRIIGVPDFPGLDHDLGRAGVSEDGKDGGFKVPTLRNIALTGPYMHNGIFETLEEVIDFYAEGGGKAHGMTDNLDPFLQGFEFNEQEKADMVAFLYSLTDEETAHQIPASVPSGLSVVPEIVNPERDVVSAVNTGSGGQIAENKTPVTLTVGEGQTVQEVVDQARPGDTVMIPYGIYHERVVINLNGISVKGVPNENGEFPIFDGENKLTEAFISSGSKFEIGNLHLRNYTDNGVIVEGASIVHFHNIIAENTGIYGIYPVKSTDVVIEDSEVSGANDAGIYAGQSENVIIRNNVVHGNVLGIEVENTVNAEVYDNYAYNNTNAILVVVLPQLTSSVSLHTKVYNNIIDENNHVNFAKPNTAAALMPPGTGIAVVGGDHVEIYDNAITNNKTAGVGIFDLRIGFDANEIDVGPIPEHVYLYGNTYEDNGYDADEFVTSLGLPGVDVLWDISGIDIWVEDEGISSFPPILPKENTSDFFYRVYWNLFDILKGLL